MTAGSGRLAFFAAAPYAAWMAMMFALPAAGVAPAPAYAAKTCAGAALLAAFAAAASRAGLVRGALRRFSPAAAGAGAAAGIATAVLWIAPEYSAFYREWFAAGNLPDPRDAVSSPFAPETCGWTLSLVRLAGSAFVIAPAEEIFFRWFLYRRLQSPRWTCVPARSFDLQAFLWTTGLFALEHDRFAAGAAAGAIYLAVYLRRGLLPAAFAHSLTNLALGVWALSRGEWSFW